MSHIVVVGAGQAAASLVAKLRSLKFDGRITVVGEEHWLPYQRPPLSKSYLLGELSSEQLLLKSPRFWQDARVEFLLGRRVVAFEPESRRVRLSHTKEHVPGEGTAAADWLSYDALVLATGGRARRIAAEAGGEQPGVYALRSIRDVEAMRREFQPGRHLCVIGGGFIGLEAAAVARKMGLEVSLLHRAPRLLDRVCGPETSAAMQALHSHHGVAVHLGVEVVGVSADSGKKWVELGDSGRIGCDFVLAGIGLEPNVELAAAAGAQVEGGIVTDSFGRTTLPDVWAIGDCAAFPAQGGLTRLESVGHAIDHGELVAQNLLGGGISYLPKPWFWSNQYELRLQMAGLSEGHDLVVRRGVFDPSVKDGTSHWYFKNNTLIAVDALNDPRAYMTAKRMIDTGQSPAPEAISDQNIPLKYLIA